MRAALAMSPPSTRSSVASAAAQHTGLPPKVEPCAPLSQVSIDSRGHHGADRHARAESLGGQQDVGLHALVVAGPHLPGPADAALHFVRHQQDAVFVAQGPQVAQPSGRRDDVAAFTLNRLHEDGRHVPRVEMPAEQLLDGADAAAGALVAVGAELAAVPVRVGHVVHVRQQRPEAGVLARLARGERSPPRCCGRGTRPRNAMIAVRRVA